MYRSEWNIHAYYFGEDSKFPGLDPAVDTLEQSAQVPICNSQYSSQQSSSEISSAAAAAAEIKVKISSQTIESVNPDPNDAAQIGATPAKAEINKQLLESAILSRNRKTHTSYQVQLG
ncbi:uncharacterized protein RAG0_14736 [Rhynchosporium agropyri]|uniref:Uncharacterized protein n=1 Tax=Rhynchosporium agropyri TaxID=914238 RepID=A0A1E1LI26_9HELO|nr:uncharacterized protein RAG0_14736 [Rhynchosporium agropyri]